MSDRYTDPVDRFARALRAARVAPPLPVQLQPDVIEGIIANPQGNVTEQLAQHLALHTPLTKASWQELLPSALSANGTPAEKTQSVIDTAAAAFSFAGEVTLSDPVLLWPWARIAFAAVLGLVLALATLFVFLLSSNNNGLPTAAYASLAALGGLCFLGIVVLVMGYKNVTIKGGTPSSSAG